MFVCCLTSPSRVFGPYGGVTIVVKGCKIQVYPQQLQPLNREGSLPEVRPLFTLSHRGSDNSPLLTLFKWTLYFHIVSWYRPNRWLILNAVQFFEDDEGGLAYLHSCIKVTIVWSIYRNWHWTRSVMGSYQINPLCDSINRGLTLVRLYRDTSTKTWGLSFLWFHSKVRPNLVFFYNKQGVLRTFEFLTWTPTELQMLYDLCSYDIPRI